MCMRACVFLGCLSVRVCEFVSARVCVIVYICVFVPEFECDHASVK